MKLTDIEVLAAIYEEARNGSDLATRIAERQHFKVAYRRTPDDLGVHPEPGRAVSEALVEKFGRQGVMLDSYVPRGYSADFPVLQVDGRIMSSLMVSNLLPHIPVAAIDFVFVDQSIRGEAQRFIAENRTEILSKSGEEDVT